MRTACSAGDHGGAGQLGLADDFVQTQFAHQGHEDEESAEAGAESAWLEIEGANIGNGGGFGPDDGGPFVVASARQAGEAFLMQKDGQGVDADGMPLGGQFALNVVDGQDIVCAGRRRVRGRDREQEHERGPCVTWRRTPGVCRHHGGTDGKGRERSRANSRNVGRPRRRRAGR